MDLVVETGLGLPAADAYVDRAGLRSYMRAQGLTLPAEVSDENLDQAVRRASRGLDLMYGDAWLGRRATAQQGLDWPRRDVLVDGAKLPSTAVPLALVYATCEAAWREASSPGVLLPDFRPGEFVVSESVGPLSTTYAPPTESQMGGEGVTFRVLDRLLRRLVSEPPGGAVSTTFVRRA